MQRIKTLGEMQHTIHNQHEHQALQKTDQQRDLLDHRGNLGKQRRAVAAAHAQWHEAQAELSAVQDAQGQREEKLAFLEFQLKELDALAMEPDEYTTLSPERDRLANAGQLSADGLQAIAALYDGESHNAQSLLAEASRHVQAISAIDP